MIVVETHAEMALNQHRDANTGPQFRRPAMLFGPNEKQFLQVTMLLGRQARLWARMGLGRKAVCMFVLFEPAVNGGPSNMQHPCDRLRTLALVHGLHCLPASSLQFRCG